ncbi:flagellar biosynthesis anti-sigma factor FlgM [Microbulbifer celer]|uniref:Negative regulator of flagellin synthesis n=1 Tax=Microbulbifer celer TaxID=435905 RepID=A0ABW3U3U0_9GAMM|nr:flagellar biosynthesis anti-sigma factor FlgM [Microbulbifer celer]UFN57818.1 flagellar biosynthesis anti-sigma factor FlgM [Microbulbifer celer]
MKIHNITRLTPSTSAQEATGNDHASKTAQRATTTTSAPAAPGASQLHPSSLPESQDIDALRVEELREAISSGAFTVHAERIADRLIASLSEQSPADDS